MTRQDKIKHLDGAKFGICSYTKAPLRMDMRISFAGKTAQEVFTIMGDPERITDWYLLAERIALLPPDKDGHDNFDVVFAFFGQVHEEILHWDMPCRYVYKASGPDFPIKDYVALIEVQNIGSDGGVMIWRQYFDQIKGEHYQKLLPVMLPPINEASLNQLAGLIGGYKVEMDSYF